MFTLILVGIVSGIITAISPCVLPVLPAILTSSIQDGAANRRRPIVVVGGLVSSFAVFTLLGGVLLSALHLPQDVLRWAGIVTLALVGVGLAVPAVGHILERPFQNTKMPTLNRGGNGFVMGLALGLVFVPCAGPILASITVLAATAGLSWGLVALTLAFSLGVAVPLLAFGVAGQAIGGRIKAVRERLQAIRIASGVVLIATALVIATNIAEPLQRIVPGFVASAQDAIENNDSVQGALDDLSGREPAGPATGSAMSFDQCAQADGGDLHNCGRAPDFEDIEAWLNTDGKALSLDSLKGQVVLVDFWTYSCINCQRTLPYLTAWDDKYRDQGLTIVGVHAPEFAFEHVISNVQSAAGRYGVDYPIAIDNNFATWRNYDNRFWPAHYLIDQEGVVRQVHYGEGGYAETEQLIQRLLDSPATGLVDADEGNHTAGRNPETYVGLQRMQYANNPEVTIQGAATAGDEIDFTAVSPSPNTFSFGGRWLIEDEYSQAVKDATLDINVYGAEANLVLGGEGTVTVTIDSMPSYRQVIDVSGVSDLYTLYEGEPMRGVMHLEFTPGVQAFAFTFG